MGTDPKQGAIPRNVCNHRRLTTWLLLVSITVLLSMLVQQSYFGRPLLADSNSFRLQSQRPNTIRVRVNLVPVDVIATDENGRTVTNLKQDDFVIFENGNQQEIRHFSIQTLVPESVQPTPALQVSGPLNLEPQSARTFLILMGRGRIQSPFRAVDAAIRFVRKDLLPQDRVAFFAYNRATAFTTNHEAIALVLERYKALHEKIEAAFDIRFSGTAGPSLAAIYGSNMPEMFQPMVDKIFALPDESTARHVPSGQAGSEAAMAKDVERAANEDLKNLYSPTTSELSRLDVKAITDLSFAEYTSLLPGTSLDMENLYTCIRYMRYMPGEKHLLFFTEKGLFFPRLDYGSSIAAYANDARVAIDTIQTGGTPYSRDAALVFAVSNLRNISELTGGRASIREYPDKALNRVNEGTRTVYLLGYYPKDENWDGKYRHIEVKVRRRGVNVAFRHGYFASEKVMSASPEEIMVASRLSAALGYARDISDVPFQFTVTNVPNLLTAPVLRVDVTVDAAKVGLKNVDGVYTGKLHSGAFAVDDKGKVVSEIMGAVDISFKAEDYAEIMKSGIHFSMTIPHKSSNQVLKIIVYDTGTERLGSRVQRIGK